MIGLFQRKYSFFGDYERQIVDALLQCSNSNSLLDKLKKAVMIFKIAYLNKLSKQKSK